MGGSLVCYHHRKEEKRMLLRIEGVSFPKSHFLEISPKLITELQKLADARDFHFDDSPDSLLTDPRFKIKEFKQPPPDWYNLRRKK
jgi:hypothetical protein